MGYGPERKNLWFFLYLTHENRNDFILQTSRNLSHAKPPITGTFLLPLNSQFTLSSFCLSFSFIYRFIVSQGAINDNSIGNLYFVVAIVSSPKGHFKVFITTIICHSCHLNNKIEFYYVVKRYTAKRD